MNEQELEALSKPQSQSSSQCRGSCCFLVISEVSFEGHMIQLCPSLLGYRFCLLEAFKIWSLSSASNSFAEEIETSKSCFHRS